MAGCGLYCPRVAVQKAIDLNPGLPELARRYCLTARSLHRPRNGPGVALEAALKMKEISLRHAGGPRRGRAPRDHRAVEERE